MLSCSVAALAYAPSLTPSVTSVRAASPSMDAKTFKEFHAGFTPDYTLEKDWTSGEISDKAGLIALSKKLNPIVGYWDPLEIGDKSKETIAFFRQAEIKHGRVAMAAFVGFTVQSLGAHFPWNIQGGLVPGNACARTPCHAPRADAASRARDERRTCCSGCNRGPTPLLPPSLAAVAAAAAALSARRAPFPGCCAASSRTPTSPPPAAPPPSGMPSRRRRSSRSS